MPNAVVPCVFRSATLKQVPSETVVLRSVPNAKYFQTRLFLFFLSTSRGGAVALAAAAGAVFHVPVQVCIYTYIYVYAAHVTSGGIAYSVLRKTSTVTFFEF